ncbi:LOW QUALITY PROTEIN: hypothetical protein OSB04_001573 [Centaurea solstitialis]|uniref:Protein kinase domain-containing protein n=1 Tax=Centaurea solstitialis TaxID=347529 RepID=A0AA38WLJ4_9ASTR|nr:LOW QUALITY PROTEIN: hypothetical protein OSB04_001573 [Centaurea solstitialis]
MNSSMVFKSFLLLHFLLVLGVLSADSISKDEEEEALKHFKNSITDDPTGALLDWNPDSTHHCNWTGIQCDDDSGLVISISIQEKQLKGQISPFLGNLSSLQILDLTSNSFTGIIPSQLHFCTQLSTLSLYANSLSGRIPPELGKLRNLQLLDLGHNSLSGSIPVSLCNCTSLVQLSLDENQLNGTIPDRIGDLINLQLLGAFGNLLQGSIPTSVGLLKELQALDFSVNRLSGTVPREIGNLSSLQVLQLFENSFSGEIPPEVGRCTNLALLNLYRNKFVGAIPEELGNLVGLQFLRLYDNRLNSTIPSSLFRLKSLLVLQLGRNNLSGNVSSDIGFLESLQSLTLHENKLSGKIPESITRLVNLTYLTASLNFLTGTIPSRIGSLHNLKNLSLSNNLLEGSIPSSLSNCTSMRLLDLSRNRISGEIPEGLGRLSNLTSLSLGDNRISGRIPDDIFDCLNLKILDLAHNNITGLLSSRIGRLSSLQILQIHGNLIFGQIPREIGNLTSLMLLNLGQNRFSGTIPVEISKVPHLQSLLLGNNILEGQIPEEIFELKQLTELYLMDNKFIGSIPRSFSNLELLSRLDLSGNGFNGSIPDSLMKLNQLILIDLSHNSLTGSISGPLVSSFKNLQIYLNLSSNFLTGKIPNELGDLEMVEAIDFSNNNLSGGIPITLQRCRNLGSLDFSRNRFSGSLEAEIFPSLDMLASVNLSSNMFDDPGKHRKFDSSYFRRSIRKKFTGLIPENFGNISTLKHLNLSFNRLEGRIPDSGIFRNASAVELLGNPSLCVSNDTKSCAISSRSNHSANKISRKAVLILAILGSLALFLVLIISVLCYRHVRIPKVKESENPDPEYARGSILKRFDRKELEKATNDFNEGNIVGSSSLSTVYKGRLEDGTTIAVKILNFIQYSTASDRSFNREMKTLSKLRHRNLVKVIGYAWESGKLKSLVLEFMENGNLDQVIHDSRVDRSRWGLSERVEVLVSVSRGLVYLHSGYDFPIVHCDLKPSNILLDGKWEARVSDFGTARILGVHKQDGSSVSSGSAFEGTIGYLAPEFAYMRKVTTKVDVFSFGIIMMEFITRKRPTGLTEEDGLQITLPQLVDQAVSSGFNEVIEIVDPDLNSNFSTKQRVIEQLLKLALCCTRMDPEDRPDMNEVLSSLSKISKKV